MLGYSRCKGHYTVESIATQFEEMQQF